MLNLSTDMTNLEATKAEIAPYTADRLMIEKALIDNDIVAADDYVSENSKKIAKVSITILTSFLSLTAESEGGFSQSFDKEGLKVKIDSLAKANGISIPSVATNIIRDKSDCW